LTNTIPSYGSDNDGNTQTKPDLDNNPNAEAVRTTVSDNETSQSTKKKSPADAFLELKDVVNTMRAELYDLKEYSSALIELSDQQKMSYKKEGRIEGIDSLSRIHQLLFRKVANMDMGKEENNSYIRQLYDNVEGELKGLGVTVIFPKISDIPTYEDMVAVGSTKSSIMHKPNTISKVEACGYSIRNGDEIKILRKAEVVVYRKSSEVK